MNSIDIDIDSEENLVVKNEKIIEESIKNLIDDNNNPPISIDELKNEKDVVT